MYQVKNLEYVKDVRAKMREQFEELNEQQDWTKLDLLQSSIELTRDFILSHPLSKDNMIPFEDIMCICDSIVNVILDMDID